MERVDVMPRLSRGQIAVATGLGAAFVWLCACSATRLVQHPYPKSAIDIAVSLQVGTVQTPEFPVIAEDYYIMIQAEGVLPAGQMLCMMGMYRTPLAHRGNNCSSDDPLLRTDWVVLDTGRVIARGSSPPDGHFMFNKEEKIKVIGYFSGQAGKKYAVEVKFTKDATALDVANPHLIVILRKHH